MCRLIQPDSGAAGERDRGADSPARPHHLGALNIFRSQLRDGRIEIVAHQVQDSAQQSVVGVDLREFAVRRVNRSFRWRHGENQPAIPHIHRTKPQNITKEDTIRFGVRAVEKDVSANHHAAQYIRIDAVA